MHRAWSRLLASVVSGCLVLSILAPATAAPGPDPDEHFNNPVGSYHAQRRLLYQVLDAINASPRGSTIRGAVYSMASPRVTDALIRAHRRGVRVRIIVPRKRDFAPVRRLRKNLGASAKGSFVRYCDRSCRGTGGEMHMKFWSFYRTGKFKNVVMIGSNNLTTYNHERQWNDLYVIVKRPGLFRVTKNWFESAQRDRPRSSPGIAGSFQHHRFWIGPLKWTQRTDPIVRRLRHLSCQPPKGKKKPRIRIATHGWNGKDRGRYLARTVAKKARQGCVVRVVFGVGTGSAVRSIIDGSPARTTNGHVKGVRTHEKLMIITNAWYSKSPHEVWTGSMNWSDRASRNDDLMMQIRRSGVGRRYSGYFERMWRKG